MLTFRFGGIKGVCDYYYLILNILYRSKYVKTGRKQDNHTALANEVWFP